MSGITVLSGDADLEQKVVTIFGRKVAVRRVWSQQWRDSAEVSMDACAADPELLIIGPDLPLEVVRYVVADVDRQFRSTTTAVLINNPEVQVSMDLLRLGAREVLPTGLDESKFQAKLDPVLQLAQERHERAGGERASLRRRVIAVISPKGGTGKTTLATNLAIGLANQVPKQVLLVDLDLQFGDCASAMGVKPEHSLTEAIQATSHERSGLKVFLTSHSSGLVMLPPPEDLAAADNIDVDDLEDDRFGPGRGVPVRGHRHRSGHRLRCPGCHAVGHRPAVRDHHRRAVDPPFAAGRGTRSNRLRRRNAAVSSSTDRTPRSGSPLAMSKARSAWKSSSRSRAVG